ncbi:hypothetical protein HYH03_014083 [Edaphochlamys debaryana]|uniref:Uncharacterized protein n=1 Tax=Edaphochlamys debaryana TaxID=47281 RepID=A0A836BS90_9CHLO|nr:hypothetical protein HYH03_014083 [Edaphochlamys debaryana]|eukprot:KAG2487241.1 hypothetical protein HYH03_014083 [Edaphochlamys debaryana]
MPGGGARSSPGEEAKSWEAWHTEFLAPLRDDRGSQVFGYRVGSIVCLLLPRCVMCVLGCAVAATAATFDTALVPDPACYWVVGGSLATWVALLAWARAKRMYTGSGLKSLNTDWRWFKAVVQVASVCAVAYVLVATLILPQRGIRFAGVLITLSLVDGAYRQADVLVGLALAAVLVVLTSIGQIGLIMLNKEPAEGG